MQIEHTLKFAVGDWVESKTGKDLRITKIECNVRTSPPVRFVTFEFKNSKGVIVEECVTLKVFKENLLKN